MKILHQYIVTSIEIDRFQHLYKNWLELLGAVVEGQMHSSRFQDIFLSILPDLKTHLKGKYRVGEFFLLLFHIT